MEPRPNLLTDLSVFKFSETPAQAVTNLAVIVGALILTVALAPGGLAQVRFELDGQPLHAMLEIISQEHHPAGVWMHRGRVRGITHESRDRIYSCLSREQLRRLRERGLLPHPPESQAEPPFEIQAEQS